MGVWVAQLVGGGMQVERRHPTNEGAGWAGRVQVSTRHGVSMAGVPDGAAGFGVEYAWNAARSARLQQRRGEGR